MARAHPAVATAALAASLAAALAAQRAAAAPPGEATGLRVAADRLTWDAAPDATSWNVLRGTSPRAGDARCLAAGLPTPQLDLADPPPPGGLHYLLVTASNADGEGPAGAASDGSPRRVAEGCDADADGVRDASDNCLLVANPSQADQDEDGEGDRCDPQTYDFEGDAPGARPSGTSWVGGLDPTFAVREDASGDRVASYAGDVPPGVHDRLDRVEAAMPFQDTTVHLDVEDVAQFATIELSSDGSWAENAGSGLIVQVGADGRLYLYERLARSVPQVPGPVVGADGRLRLRLVKGPGSTSTVHVDLRDGAGWLADAHVWTIADDSRFSGTATLVANYIQGRRGIRRITVDHAAPPGTLTIAKDARWSCDWKLFQRAADGTAAIPLRFAWRLDEPSVLRVRVVDAATRLPLPGHDEADHELALPPSAGRFGELRIAGVPTGGNYDVEARLVRARDGVAVGGGVLRELAVGDVWLAAGQSNMSGWSGTLAGAEPPIDAVHLFGNDGRWKRAEEPCDSGTDQVDLVSAEAPAHSPMLAFGKALHAASGVPVGIVPGPLGGTNLWVQWQRNAAYPDDRGTLYGSLLHRALLQGGESPAGMAWLQGESDAINGRTGEQYRADLEQLVASARVDLAAPELYASIAQIGCFVGADLPRWLPIQEAHRRVAAADARAGLATCVDQPLSDGIHYTVAGYREIGRRLAAAVLEEREGLPVDALAEPIAARVATGGADAVELDFDADVRGGAAELFRVTDASGDVPVIDASAAGRTVRLLLGRGVTAPAAVSYGWSRDPGAPWLEDLRGVAVPVFDALPLEP